MASLSYGFESQSVDVSFQVRDLGGNKEQTDGKKKRVVVRENKSGVLGDV